MNDHSTNELVKHADARGGCRVHARIGCKKNMGDEVRRRLVATQRAIGESPDVTQSTPPLMVARLLLEIASLQADGNEAHDWTIGVWEANIICVTFCLL